MTLSWLPAAFLFSECIWPKKQESCPLRTALLCISLFLCVRKSFTTAHPVWKSKCHPLDYYSLLCVCCLSFEVFVSSWITSCSQGTHSFFRNTAVPIAPPIVASEGERQIWPLPRPRQHTKLNRKGLRSVWRNSLHFLCMRPSLFLMFGYAKKKYLFNHFFNS